MLLTKPLILTLFISKQRALGIGGNIAPNLRSLGKLTVKGQDPPALGTLEPGDVLEAGGGTAAARRVLLPWGGTDFDFDSLNEDGKTIMRRAMEWAADKEVPE